MCGVFAVKTRVSSSNETALPEEVIPPLTGVRVVTQTRLAGLPHVADAISQALDTTNSWTIAGAARIGSVWLLQRLRMLHCCGGMSDYGDRLVVQNAMLVAASAGHVAVLQWLQTDYGHERTLLLESWESLVCAAVERGHIEVLQWLDTTRATVDLKIPVPSKPVSFSPTSGSLASWRRVQRTAISISSSGFTSISFITSCQPKFQVSVSLIHTVNNGHLHVLQWFHRHRPQDLQHDNLLTEAAATGALHIVQWLHETLDSDSVSSFSGSCSGSAVGNAAENGHLHVVQWLLSHRSEEFPSRAPHGVARNGHLDVLQWLYSDPHCRELFTDGCTSCLGDAAEGGHLAIVQWLHAIQPQNMAAWRAIDLAASNGHLDVVKWLHEHRHDPCCARAMDLAATNGHLQVVQFLHENRREGCTQDAMDGAARNGHLQIVRFLHTNRHEGCSPRAMDGAAWNNHVDIVHFLHANRHEGCSTMAMHGAARHGNVEMLQFLSTNRSEGCEPLVAIRLAVEAKSASCVQWLLAQYPRLYRDQELLRKALFVARATPGVRNIVQLLCQELENLRKPSPHAPPIHQARRKRIRFE